MLLPPAVQTHHSSKSIPVYKWNLQFSVDSKGLGVNSVLERVSELAASRNVNKDELFDSAIELFSGKALIWLRSIKSSLVDWNSLVSALKRDFLPSDYEDQLWKKIKNRKQGVIESVTMFIATMESFFRRFDREVTHQQGGRPNGSKQSINVLEPDLAYISENSSMSQHNPATFYTPSHNQSSKTPDPSSAYSEEFKASASSSKGYNGPSRVFSNSKNKTSSFTDKGVNFNRASNKPSYTTAMGKRATEIVPRGHKLPRRLALAKKYTSKFFWNKRYSNTYNIKESAHLLVEKSHDNRPFISVKLFDKEIVALLDSRANSSIVGKDGITILKAFKLKISNCNHKFVTTADGVRQTVKGIVELPLYI
ncbi:hypothetical protein ILUMI_14286, partial [Ignelater luminosus]